MLVAGAILVAVLAILTERGFTLAERRLVSPGIRLAQGAGEGAATGGLPAPPPAAVA
jgi:hypothetical protein